MTFVRDAYDVIKIHGKYNRTPENDLYRYNIHSTQTEPTLNVKTIYSVRKNDCLFNFKYYREE